jgi:hypothetical protein
MLAHSALKSAGCGLFSALLALAAIPHNSVRVAAQTPASQSGSQARQASDSPPADQQPPPATGSNRPTRGSGKGNNTVSQSEVPASQRSPGREGHPAETNPGRTPHSSENGAIIAGASVGAAVVIGELIAHHNKSPEKLLHDGPQVPDSFDMSGFVIKGLVHPNWPIVLDFMIDSPGAVQVDILASDKHHYQATLLNTPNRRAYAIFRLPPNFGTKLQTAVYHVSAIPTRGASTPPPRLRTYGLGAGDHAVGSVAIDQLTFQPATIHPQAKEVANYSFHAHSAFDGVRAEFIFTTLYNGHLLVQKEDEKKLSPIPEGERARGTWGGKKPGEHMLQVRAWRGLENGGDWVVAWSPDIVDVVK